MALPPSKAIAAAQTNAATEAKGTAVDITKMKLFQVPSPNSIIHYKNSDGVRLKYRSVDGLVRVDEENTDLLKHMEQLVAVGNARPASEASLRATRKSLQEQGAFEEE